MEITSMLKDTQVHWVNCVWDKLCSKLSKTSVAACGKIPYTTVNGVWTDARGEAMLKGWIQGFWPGLMWLMYVGTGEECYKKAAEAVEERMDAALAIPTNLHHDVGFIWRISSGVNYQLFGGEKSRQRTYMASLALAARFNPAGSYLRAFNGEGREGSVIIDTLMNLPLLYWASDESKDPRFKNIAMWHADRIMDTHLRPDGSVYHIVEIDPNTGEVTGYDKGGGYSVEGCWSRGQAWAIYGFALSYLHTGKQEYLEASKKVAHYFVSEIACNGWLPKTDFRAPSESVDTTAGAIAASGLIELARAVPEEQKHLYLNGAMNLLQALEANFCDWTEAEDSILQHGVENYNEERLKGKPIIYGDFYFTEAIYKLKGFEPLFW